MALNYTDLTSGRTPELSGEKLEAFEDALLQQVEREVTDAEEYLEENIRPNIAENWEYYNGEKPEKIAGEPGFVDNTCTATVDHYVSACMDAFTSGDTLEVIPDGVTNPMTLKVINQVMNDVMDNENSRHTLYHSFFTDAFVSSASVMRPKVTEETCIEKEFFTDAEEDVLQMRQMQLETEMAYDDVELIVTEKKTVEVEQTAPIDPSSLLGQMDMAAISSTTSITTYTGYFLLVYKEKTIKIEPVPAENFLINKDARSIQDARIVGHKAMVTISDLLSMGIDEDKVLEVYEKCSSGEDVNENVASQSRRFGLYNMNDDESLDNSQREVELYELYIKSSVEETYDDESAIAVSKLYQVFYCEGVLLSYQETDEVPYVGASPIPRPHMFWGDGMVDRTKSIQRARTGLLRQTFVYNDMASRPRFEYVPENIKNPRDLFSNKAGAGIAVSQLGSIQPIQLTALTGDNAGMMNMLDTMREAGTGMSFTGQGMMGDVLKSGASTTSAAMVLSEGQMVQKKVINNLLQSAIIPLIRTIYNMLRENFSEWEIVVQGETMKINPNQWPKLRDVQIKTPLGTNAKIEQSQKYGNLAQVLSSAQPGTELSKLANAKGIKELMVKSYELMDVPDAQYYMTSDQEMAMKDQLTQTLTQMQQQMQQLTVQMQEMAKQNQVLQATATQMAMKELELREREVAIKEQDSLVKAQQAEASMQNMADEQLRKETMDEATMQNMADQQALDEREEDRKDLQTATEISTGTNIFSNN